MSHNTKPAPNLPTAALTWGYNNRVGLGLGHTARVSTPIPVRRLPADTVDVQGGISLAVALTAEGALHAWAPNQYSQLDNSITR